MKEKGKQIKINSKLYPMHVVLKAAKNMESKAYVLIDGDPATNLVAIIKPKGDEKNVDKEFVTQLALELAKDELNE